MNYLSFYAQVFLLLAAAAVIAGLVIAQLADPFEDVSESDDGSLKDTNPTA